MNWNRLFLALVSILAVASAGCGGTPAASTKSTVPPTPAAPIAAGSATGTPSPAVTPAASRPATTASDAEGSAEKAAIFVLVAGADGTPAIDVFSLSTGALLAQTPLGIPTPDWTTVYVTTSSGGATTVRALDPRSGRERGALTMDGAWTVPSALAGVASDAFARDAGLLVLADQSPPARESRFAILPTSFAYAPEIVSLRGRFAFDAISPNGAILYLIEEVGAPADGHYNVRAFDRFAGALLPDPIVDKREIGELMEGAPIARATSASGQWAYTVYVKDDGTAFVHELDTVHSIAFCGDLPESVRAETGEQRAAWRIGIAGDELPFVVNGRLGLVGLVENEAVKRVGELPSDRLVGDSEIVVPGGSRPIYLVGPAGLSMFDPWTLEPLGATTETARGVNGGALLLPDGAGLLTADFGAGGATIERFSLTDSGPLLASTLTLEAVAGLTGARLVGVSADH